MRNREAAQSHREAMAAEYRAGLERELTLDGSFSQSRLIDAAVSNAVEVSVLSAKFIRCSATSAELERLGRARSELGRTLRQLGVAPKTAPDDEDTPPGSALAAYLAAKRAKEGADDA
jgi:DNA-binding transcriptional MocR family regulator